MNDLSDDAKSLIDEVRNPTGPAAADVERVRARLVDRLGPGAFASPGALEAAKTAAPGSATSGVGPMLKLVLGLGVIGLVVGGVILARSTPDPVPGETASLDVPVTEAAPEVSVTLPVPASALEVERPIPKASAPPRSSRTPQPTASSPAVADELAILTGAYSALKKGNAEKALSELDRHATRFPDGALAEERAAQRILALCELGRVEEARADASAFSKRYPGSPQAARVRSSCGGTAP